MQGTLHPTDATNVMRTQNAKLKTQYSIFNFSCYDNTRHSYNLVCTKITASTGDQDEYHFHHLEKEERT